MNIFPYANGALTNTAVLAVNLTSGGTCTLDGLTFGNEANSAASYLQIFDAASTGAVTLGSTAPTIIIDAPALLGNSMSNDYGLCVFKKGVVIAATTTATGSTAPSSNCSVTLFFH